MAARVLIVARKPLLRNPRIFNQAKSLTGAGYEVTVVGIDAPGARTDESRNGYRIVRLPIRPLGGRLLRIIRRSPAEAGGPAEARQPKLLDRLLAPALLPLRAHEFRKQVERFVTTQLPPPSIVHANDLDALTVCARLARRYRVPLVYDAQELYTHVHFLPWWYRQVLKLEERRLVRRVDRIVTVNPEIAHVLERTHRREVDVVLNCPESGPARPGEMPGLRQALQIAEDVPLIVYSGGLLRQRGLENTVRALRHLPGAILALLGEGPLEGELRALAEREQLSDRVRFHSYVEAEQVPGFISSADVGIIPYENVGLNHYLASPSKLFHYLMAGLPVACSDFPFLRSVVIDNGIGAVFDPGDPRSIASALSTILGNPGLRVRMREQLLELGRRYSWEVEEEKFLAVYRNVPS